MQLSLIQAQTMEGFDANISLEINQLSNEINGLQKNVEKLEELLILEINGERKFSPTFEMN
jgi:flagellar capping protein FliD